MFINWPAILDWAKRLRKKKKSTSKNVASSFEDTGVDITGAMGIPDWVRKKKRNVNPLEKDL